jgi:hypothetical protein
MKIGGTSFLYEATNLLTVLALVDALAIYEARAQCTIWRRRRFQRMS